MRCAQIPFGSKQCYLTYRIGTFQLTRITLEILTTIRIKKIQDSMFVTCSCAVLGVFVGHCYWGGFEFLCLLLEEKERKEKHVPSSFLDMDRPKKANTTFCYCYPSSWLLRHGTTETQKASLDLLI